MNHEQEARSERKMLNEIAFWGVHDFHDHWAVISCTRCGWGFWDVLHTGKTA